MKYFLLLLILFPVLGWSFPSLNDYVRHEADYRGEKVIMEKSLIDYNTDADASLQLTRITFKGEVISEQEHVLQTLWFYTPAKVQNVLKDCTGREGARGHEMIQGKRIETCSFYHEDSQLTYSIGMVPFGQVRHQVYLGDGEFLDFNLVEFRSP
jgi:hypothetical protein